MAFEDEFTFWVDGVLDVGYKLDELDGEVSSVICGTRSRICGEDRERPSAAVVRASLHIVECSHSALRNVLGCRVFLPTVSVCLFQSKRSGSSDTHAASVAIKSDGPALAV